MVRRLILDTVALIAFERRTLDRSAFDDDDLAVAAVTAAEHAELLAHLRRAGRPRGAHALMIAAHAIEHDRAVVSLDRRAGFCDLPGVEVVVL